MESTNKEKKEGTSSKLRWEAAVSIIVALIALTGVIYSKQMDWKIQKSMEAHEKQMKEQETYKLEFSMEQQDINRAGIEYTKYEISLHSSDPSINGFHIRPYVYAIMKLSGEKKYIPVERQFLQAEYASGSDGVCILYKEKTTDELLDLLKEQGYDAQLECMLAIEYTVNGKAQVNIYTLRTGQLEVAADEEILDVLEAWEHLEDIKIDMMFWPIGREEQIKEILETIG